MSSPSTVHQQEEQTGQTDRLGRELLSIAISLGSCGGGRTARRTRLTSSCGGRGTSFSQPGIHSRTYLPRYSRYTITRAGEASTCSWLSCRGRNGTTFLTPLLFSILTHLDPFLKMVLISRRYSEKDKNLPRSLNDTVESEKLKGIVRGAFCYKLHVSKSRF